jgi:hypothetical protein
MKYLQALSLYRAHSTLLNLAVVEVELGKYDEALLHLRGFVVHPKASPEKVALVKKEMLPDLLSRTGHLEVKAPGGAVVKVDGKEWGKAPLETIDVMPGKHVVAAGERSSEVSVKGGESRVVDLLPPPAPAPTASASSTPGPFTPPPRDDEKPGAGRWIGPIVLGVLGVAGVGAGVGFALSSQSKEDEATRFRDQTPRPCADRASASCAAYDEKRSAIATAQTLSWVGYGVGAAGLVGAGVWAALAVRSGKAGSLRLAPVGGPDAAGLQLDGRF